MPFDKPILDNRDFDQLVAEGRGKIPRLAPDWTDHNASDPGITLLELFSWLTEMAIYRLDLVPEESQRTFLRLLGIEQKLAGIAHAVLTIDSKTAAGSVMLPAGLQVTGAEGGPLFEITRSLSVSPAKLVSILVGSPNQFEDFTTRNGEGLAPFGSEAKPGIALFLGFDQPLGSVGDRVSLHSWTHTAAKDWETWQRIITEWRAVRRELASCHLGAVAKQGLRNHFSARTVWEYYRGNNVWETLPEIKDNTWSFGLSGFIRFRVPPGHAPGGIQDGKYFLRCRLVSGGYSCPPSLLRIGLNAVPAIHAALIEDEGILGVSRGHAQEIYRTQHYPVVTHSARLRWSLGGQEDISWTEVRNWDRTGFNDRHFVLESESGRFSFGDGLKGSVPLAGWKLEARYRIGGGPAGNLAPESLNQLVLNGHNLKLKPTLTVLRKDLELRQPYAAFGGKLSEDITAAKGRAMEILENPDKAVTLADFERLAREVPGVSVNRARALADHCPELPCVTASGLVTVVVVPDCPGPKPSPNSGFLQAVAAFLGRRRLLTCELRVIPPCYDTITVYATLHTGSSSEIASLRALAQAALDRFFHPLHGGPEGTGWPIGRHVYHTEVLALLATLPDIQYVSDLRLQSDKDPEPSCGNLTLCPDCLPTSARHVIVIKGTPRITLNGRSKRNDC